MSHWKQQPMLVHACLLLKLTCCRIAANAARRSEWRAAVEASAAAAAKQLDELSQRVAADAAAAPGRDARLLHQAQDAAAAQVKQQVAEAKAELLRDLEGWGEKVQAAAGEAAAERVKAAGEVCSHDGGRDVT